MVNVKDAGLVYSPYSGRVSVYLFGRLLDWNISGDEQEEVRSRLRVIARELDVLQIYAPRPSTFNAQICDPGDLQETTDLGEGVLLHRGRDADGVIVPERAAFWLSSADCLTIIAHDPEKGTTIAAHGGRDCLVDRGRINGTSPPRASESVVDAIAARFSNAARKRLKVFLTCGIAPDHFDHPCDHPQLGTRNTLLVFDALAKWGSTCVYGDYKYGSLCLSEIVRAQFLKHGVQVHNIAYDGVDTYSDTGPDGQLRWWSYRRGDGKKRNGVLVVRNW